MREKLITLTKKLIEINSVSSTCNKNIIDIYKELLVEAGYITELLTYKDPNNIDKYNLIARKGSGIGGLAFLIHSDTVPIAEDSGLFPKVVDNKLYGRGACDMKGPAAASVLAALQFEITKKPITFIITSDEEIGCEGAEFIAKHSKMLKDFPPQWGIATEPTELKPVYAHKGVGQIVVTAYGKAAHSSTNIGQSANFKMIPFMSFISGLKTKYDTDKTYQNSSFEPPTNTLNLTLSDFNCAMNVTAARSRCKICFRSMPDARTKDVIEEISVEAKRLGLEISSVLYDSLHTDPKSPVVTKSEKITGRKSETVSYLTDASQFSNIFQPIILGPGSIKQAHTTDEYIEINQLVEGFNIYKDIIEALCN
ncbi:MAG: M20/M25/M40 family metallo-hydrolase [Spirochaetaceae bacterium]